MAKRIIREEGDTILLKHCREVTKFDDRLHELIDDMRETLLAADGVGLAAPQVGILRRVVLVSDLSKEDLPPEEQIVELVNPEIIESSGENSDTEGCLSLPGVWAVVKRPNYVKIRAQDRFGKWFEIEGTEVTARCFCHELDHLEGHLFTEKAERILSDDEVRQMEEREAKKRRRRHKKK